MKLYDNTSVILMLFVVCLFAFSGVVVYRMERKNLNVVQINDKEVRVMYDNDNGNVCYFFKDSISCVKR